MNLWLKQESPGFSRGECQKKTKQTIGNIYDNPELLEGDNQ